MSWIDKASDKFTITTGDGEMFTPNWLNPSITKEWNISEFTFPEVSGTLAVRFQPKGRRLNIEIYFQGEDHLDTWEKFDDSSNDKRPWVISHPYYGLIIVQPVSMTSDHSQYNVSKVTVSVVETFTNEALKVTINPADDVNEKALILLGDVNTPGNFNTSGDLNVAISSIKPVASDIPNLAKKNSDLYNIAKSKINNNLDLNNYFNLFTKANTAINLFTSFPQQAMAAFQTFINYPFQFADTVKNRIATLINQFNTLFGRTNTKNGKMIYEYSASSVITTMAQSIVTNATYGNREEVFSTMTDLLDTYNEFVSNVDSIQSDTNNSEDAYLPDAKSMQDLRDLVNTTASQLFTIALNAKQQRTFICDSDTNVLLLAHRFYGLLPDDSTIDQIIADNNIGISEMLQIQKGRPIIYYV